MSRYLFIGAHPDDADIEFSGTAIKLIRKGHHVKFVSVCNGDCGHFRPFPTLARRRAREAEEAGRLIGLDEYEILPIHDCELEVTLENRKTLLRIIRRYHPDVVITHALNDYHADHRNCGQLVLDTAYLLTVPLFCPDTPIPDHMPVYAFSFNVFKNPAPFRVDAAIEIDSVLEEKLSAIACHESQIFEWLPWDSGMKAEAERGLTEAEKREALLREIEHLKAAAKTGKKVLCKIYGDQGQYITYAECFQQTEYGKILPISDFQKLMLEGTAK